MTKIVFLRDLLKEELCIEENVALVPLTETSVFRVMTDYMDYGFIIISAERTPQGEFGENPTPEQVSQQKKTNMKNDVRLRNILRNGKFGWIPVWGGYKETIVEDDPEKPGEKRPALETDPKTGEKTTKKVDTVEPEPSYIVVGKEKGGERAAKPEELKQFGLELANEFNQDAVLWKPPNSLDKNAYYLNKAGEVDMTFSGPHSVEDLKKDFYTQLKIGQGDKKQGRRFTFENKYKFIFGPTLEERVLYMRQGPAGLQEAIKRYGERFYRF